MAFIEFDSGMRAGETVALDKPKIMFGRQLSCDCVIVHPTISREHFSIERTGGKFFLVDQKSGNGTFVNGERVSWVELKHADRIKAGPFTLTFKTTDEQKPITSMLDAKTLSDADDDNFKEPAFDARHKRHYPRQYLQGIEDFNARRYFDAHEVWEEIWLRSTGDTKLFYQMLIQAAVGLHHYERDNYRGARGMYKNVVEKLQRLPSFYMSLDLADFSNQFRNFFSELIENDNERALPVDEPRPTIRLLSGDNDD